MQDETIRIDADLVSLSVRVTDEGHNNPVRGLRREDFRVFEDGVPQTISLFSTEEAPLSYGLVVCYSGRGRAPEIEKVIEAGKLIVDGNRSGDETFIARLMGGARAQIQWNFTADKKVLHEALDTLSTGAAVVRTLVDAVYLSAEHVAQSGRGGKGEGDRSRFAPRRRALILLTDGEDRHSFYKEEQLFALLGREDVQIYVIGFVGELETEGASTAGARRSKRARSIALLNRLAAETGGRVFYPNSERDLPLIAGEITRDLRTQYVVGYSPTNKRRDGSFRRLRVAVAEATPDGKRIAVTRSGYTR